MNNASVSEHLHRDGNDFPDQHYDPARLLDALLRQMQLRSDAALARALEIMPPVLSKIRHRKMPVGASILVRMHIVSELSVRELYALLFGEAAPVSKNTALQAVRQPPGGLATRNSDP